VLQQLRSKSLVIWALVFVFFVVGFLLADTSGLLGLGPARITNTTAVAKVNGVEIPWMTWQNLSNQTEPPLPTHRTGDVVSELTS